MPKPAGPELPVAAVAAPIVVVRPAISVRTLVVAALIVIAILGLLTLVASVVNLLLIILVAIVFAEGVRPLVNRLHAEMKLPRPAAIAVVYVGLIAVLVVLVTLFVQPIVDEAKSLAQNLPSYESKIQSTIASWQQQLNLGGTGTPNVGNTLAGSLDTAKNVLLTIGGYIVSVLVNLVLVLVIGFLWLVTADRLKAFVVDLLPTSQQALAADVFREMGLRMGGFLRATASTWSSSGC